MNREKLIPIILDLMFGAKSQFQRNFSTKFFQNYNISRWRSFAKKKLLEFDLETKKSLIEFIKSLLQILKDDQNFLPSDARLIENLKDSIKGSKKKTKNDINKKNNIDHVLNYIEELKENVKYSDVLKYVTKIAKANSQRNLEYLDYNGLVRKLGKLLKEIQEKPEKNMYLGETPNQKNAGNNGKKFESLFGICKDLIEEYKIHIPKPNPYVLPWKTQIQHLIDFANATPCQWCFGQNLIFHILKNSEFSEELKTAAKNLFQILQNKKNQFEEIDYIEGNENTSGIAIKRTNKKATSHYDLVENTSKCFEHAGSKYSIKFERIFEISEKEEENLFCKKIGKKYCLYKLEISEISKHSEKSNGQLIGEEEEKHENIPMANDQSMSQREFTVGLKNSIHKIMAYDYIRFTLHEDSNENNWMRENASSNKISHSTSDSSEYYQNMFEIQKGDMKENTQIFNELDTQNQEFEQLSTNDSKRFYDSNNSDDFGDQISQIENIFSNNGSNYNNNNNEPDNDRQFNSLMMSSPLLDPNSNLI